MIQDDNKLGYGDAPKFPCDLPKIKFMLYVKRRAQKAFFKALDSKDTKRIEGYFKRGSVTKVKV